MSPFILPSTTNPIRTGDVWLCADRPGVTGDGTRGNPLDASTSARFDAIITALRAAMGTPVIRMRAGHYYTKAQVSGTYIRKGWTILGEGIGATILQMDPTTVFDQYVSLLNIPYYEVSDGTYIDGISFYCNYNDLQHPPTLYSVNALVLSGSDNTVRNFEVVGGYGSLTAGEAFSAFIGQHYDVDSATWKGGKNNLMEYCLARDFVGDYGNAFVIATGRSDCIQEGTIRHFTVRNYASLDANVCAAGVDIGAVEDGVIDNVSKGVRFEQGHGVRIRRITMTNVLYQGAVMDAYTNSQDIIFEDLDIEMVGAGDYPGASGVRLSNYGGATLTGSAIKNCTVRLKNGAAHTPYGLVVSPYSSGNTVTGNRIAASLPNQVTLAACVAASDNRDLSNNLIPALNL